MSLTKEALPTALATILGLPFKLTSDGVLTLTNNILLSVQYRPYNLPQAALLMKALVDSGDDHMPELKRSLLKIPARIIEEKWRLALIHEVYCLGVYTDDEIFEMIRNAMAKFPILPNRPFWKNNHRLHFIFFVWFAPVIEKNDPVLSQRLFDMIGQSVSKRELSASYGLFVRSFQALKANDWEQYSVLTRNFYSRDSIAGILREDDVAKLQDLAERPGFEIDARIEPSVFEYASFLLRQPTLVQFCALHASIKCFNFLVASGANLTLRDAGKRFLLHFAITGGNREITRKATEVLNDFVVATRVSAEFHRFELFKIFLATEATDLKANDIENGSIFHGIAAANHIRMILFCIEQGCDVNLKDGDGWTPLNCAIDFCALESVLVLTSHVAIDVNAQDDYSVSLC